MRRAIASAVPVLGVVCLLLGVASGARAQEDERLKDLIDKLSSALLGSTNTFLRIYTEVTVNGNPQANDIQEVWTRDLQRFRAEKNDGTVVVVTPVDVRLFHGPSKVMLRVPQETLDALGEERDKAFSAVGLGMPTGFIKAVVDMRDKLTIDGEAVIGDVDCWVVTVPEDHLAEWKSLFGGIGPEMDLSAARITLEKATGILRALDMEMTGAADVTVKVSIPEVQEEVEVTDDMLQFEPPPGATVLTWQVGETPESVAQRFQQAVQAHTPPGPPGPG